MTRDRFETIKNLAADKFTIEEERQEPLDDDSGGQKDIVIFTGPLGKIKLEFTEKPRLLGEKTMYSNRIGGQVKVEKKYDRTEQVSFLDVFKWDEAEQGWTSMSADSFTHDI